MFKYKIADLIFEIDHVSSYTQNICKDYVYAGEKKTDCKIEITKADIDKEKSNTSLIASDEYFESLALYRKICSYLLNNANGLLIHSSALAVDGKAYLFTAKSGTGKSTHAKMWREYLGDKVVMVNDDKPLIREIDGKFFVYGSPWNGKHRLGINGKFEISGICKLIRGKDNKIKKIDKKEMLLVLLGQTLRPETEKEADKYFSLLSRLVDKVNAYELECTISVESAEMAYEKMSKGEW